jgi:hypothetical protein
MAGVFKKYKNVEACLDTLCLVTDYVLTSSNNVCIIENLDMLETNPAVHTVNMRNKHNLSIPVTYLTVYQKLVHCAGIKPYNCYPEILNVYLLLVNSST